MVGYQPNDSMTQQEKLVAGCLSGVITRFVTQPLDIVKLRIQLQKRRPITRNIQLFRTSRKILSEEGALAFWHGHKLGQIHSIIAVSCQFHSFELATKVAARTHLGQNHKNVTNFLSGWFAGCFSAAVVNPFEVIRVRQMLVSEQYKGILNGAKEVYRTGGLLAFYGGLGASLLQMGPSVAISFGVFSFVQPVILSYAVECHTPPCQQANIHRPENILLASTVAGSLAGFISKGLTYPFDLAKRRLQIASHEQKDGVTVPSTSKNLIKCRTLTECLAKTFRNEGLSGLFTGFKITLYKAQLSSIVAFTSYELICYGIREIEIDLSGADEGILNDVEEMGVEDSDRKPTRAEGDE